MDKFFPILILAGGLATRLGTLSQTDPKSMVLIEGEPFIAHQLRLLKKQGFKNVVICIGYLGDAIRAYVKDGKQFGLNVTYSNDGKKLLGTAGAIQNALPLLEENFFILYGDSYLRIDYKVIQKAFEIQNKAALMTVFKNNDSGDNSNIEFNNNKIIRYDKEHKTNNMKHIDFGLSIVKKNIFKDLGLLNDLSELYKKLLTQNQLASYEIFERFYEIGSIKGLNEFKDFMGKKALLCPEI